MIHDTPVLLLIRWRIGHLVKKKTQARNYLENVFIRAHFFFDPFFFFGCSTSTTNGGFDVSILTVF